MVTLILAGIQSAIIEALATRSLQPVPVPILVHYCHWVRRRPHFTSIRFILRSSYSAHNPLVQGFIIGQIGIRWIDPLLNDVFEVLMFTQLQAQSDYLSKPVSIERIIQIVVI